MDAPEFQRIVASIGEDIPARLGAATGMAECARVCSQCGERHAGSCVWKTRQIVGAGAGRVSSCPGVARLDPSNAGLIDHTQLRPETNRDDIMKACRDARLYGFAVGALRSGEFEAVKLDNQRVVEAGHRGGAIVRVILETALLDDNQKAVACTLAKTAGATRIGASASVKIVEAAA